MPILFDHNPDTGVTEYYDYDPLTDAVSITTSQDVSGFLDAMQAIRNAPEISQRGIKEEWWCYASVPEVVELALLKKGLSLTNKDHMKAIFREINTNFPYLKRTEKWHR
jgi:hypothetical protein